MSDLIRVTRKQYDRWEELNGRYVGIGGYQAMDDIDAGYGYNEYYCVDCIKKHGQNGYYSTLKLASLTQGELNDIESPVDCNSCDIALNTTICDEAGVCYVGDEARDLLEDLEIKGEIR